MDTERARERLQDERRRLESLRDQGEELAGLDEEQGESTGELADYDQHPGDAGTHTFERSKELAVQDQLDNRLADVDAALERIEAGTYGACEVCGKPIDDERLEARPTARYCHEHQQEADASAAKARDSERT